MAIVEVKVPQLSESVAEATLLQWKKKPGDAVAMDEILIEIETDKVVLEVPAPAGRRAGRTGGGRWRHRGQRPGDRPHRHRRQGRRRRAGAGAPAPAPQPRRLRPPSTSKAGVAMPAAAKLMADNHLAAGSVPGTGKDGRVTKGDVLGAVAAPAPSPPARPGAGPGPRQAAAQRGRSRGMNLGDRPEQRVPMSRLRARIAERLVQSSPPTPS
jgi:2-oxoglutarate dehydrogenase E2 component (dihydrolipoamide succinyltransferase)